MTVAAEPSGLRIEPSLEEVRSLASAHSLVPLRHTFIADTETPVSAYIKLRGDGPSFLLESAEQGQRFGRWSFLGFRPRTVIRLEEGRLTVGGEARDGSDPYAAVGRELERYRVAPLEGLPPFAGGAVGLFGYDLVRHAEPTVGPGNPDPVGTPDMALMVSDVLVAFDHLRHEVTILANVFAEDDTDRAYADAVAAIAEVRERLAAPVPRAPEARVRAGARVHQQHRRRGLRGGRRAGQGVHPRRRRLPGGAEPALERRRHGRRLLDLPRPARHQPEPVHVLPRLRGLRDRRCVSGVAREGQRQARRAAPDRGHAPARGDHRGRPRAAPRSCWRTRRSAPST